MTTPLCAYTHVRKRGAYHQWWMRKMLHSRANARFYATRHGALWALRGLCKARGWGGSIRMLGCYAVAAQWRREPQGDGQRALDAVEEEARYGGHYVKQA